MKILLVLIAISFLIVPAMAMVVEEPKEELTIKPIYDVKPVEYSSKTTLIEKIITTFTEFVGLERETISESKEEVDVKINGIIIAIIPVNSKFNGMEIHDVCLPKQYGTDGWYDCEVSL
jgi:uncharacterized membrane protein